MITSSRHPGKRLSIWRVLFGLLVVLAVATGALLGPWYFARNAPLIESQAGPRWAGGYFDVTATHADVDLASGDRSDHAVVLAFVVARSPDRCEPTWGGAYTLDEAGSALDLDRRINSVRRNGAHVVVSFGGAINTELASACKSVEELANAYGTVLDRYGIGTIDLDIEGVALDDTVAGQRRAEAIALLQREYAEKDSQLNVWLTLPVAVDGLTQSGLTAVRQMLDARVALTGVNVMTMNYGADVEGRRMSDVAVTSLHRTHDQLTNLYVDQRVGMPRGGAWALMGATPMIGQNDVVNEVFHLADAERLSAFAQDVGLARMSFWSLNRDRTCGPNYPNVSLVSDACSGVDQATRSFREILAVGFDGAPVDNREPTPQPELVPDDPATAPYPIWAEHRAYSAGVRVVHQGYVYQAKWWVTGLPNPSDPTYLADQTSWVLIGPVLPGDVPFELPRVPSGTYPEWSADVTYEANERVVVDDVPYQAKWWTIGDDPTEGITDHDRSPWAVVRSSDGEVDPSNLSGTDPNGDDTP